MSIGADIDQSAKYPRSMLGTVIKKIDSAVDMTLNKALIKNFKGSMTFGIKSKGIHVDDFAFIDFQLANLGRNKILEPRIISRIIENISNARKAFDENNGDLFKQEEDKVRACLEASLEGLRYSKIPCQGNNDKEIFLMSGGSNAGGGKLANPAM